MLEFFRQNVKSWLFVVIIVLIVASFALFGINEFLVDKSDTYVATVDGEEIPVKEYRDMLRSIQASDELAVEDKSALVERLVSQRLLLTGLGELNLRPSNRAVSERVLAEPAFQEDGQFNQERYVNALRLRGYSVEAYEESLRNSLAFEQFTAAIEDTALNFDDTATTSAVLADLLQQLQQRRYAKVIVTAADVLTNTVTVTEEEVATYYEANQAQYQLGKGVKLSFIELTAEDYGNTPTDSAVESFYQSRIGSYTTPKQFDASYVVVSSDDEFDAAFVTQLDNIIKSHTDTVTFDEVLLAVQKTSDSATVSIDSGDLGSVDKDIIEELYTEALADQFVLLEPNGVIGLQTKAGEYSIFYINQVSPGEQIPLQTVRADIEKQLRLEDAYPKLAQAQETLEIAAFENPLSLAPAAEALGVNVEVSDWIYEDGTGDALLSALAPVSAYAFSESANADGYNSEIFETDAGLVIVRFAEEKAPTVKPLSEVGATIEQLLLTQKRQASLATVADQMLVEAKASPSSATYFQEKGLLVNTSTQPLDRRAIATQDDPAIANVVFSQEVGIDHAMHYPSAANARVIVWVVDITDVDENSDIVQAQLQRLAKQQQAQVGIQEENSLLDLYREQANVIINESQL